MDKVTKMQEMLNNYSNLDLEILPHKLRKNGFDYELICRENEKCIYSQSLNGRILAYEVFKTKISSYREALSKFKKHLGQADNSDGLKEFKEVFPGDEDFGKRAWTYPTLEKGMYAYNNL